MAEDNDGLVWIQLLVGARGHIAHGHKDGVREDWRSVASQGSRTSSRSGASGLWRCRAKTSAVISGSSMKQGYRGLTDICVEGKVTPLEGLKDDVQKQ